MIKVEKLCSTDPYDFKIVKKDIIQKREIELNKKDTRQLLKKLKEAVGK